MQKCDSYPRIEIVCYLHVTLEYILASEWKLTEDRPVICFCSPSSRYLYMHVADLGPVMPHREE